MQRCSIVLALAVLMCDMNECDCLRCINTFNSHDMYSTVPSVGVKSCWKRQTSEDMRCGLHISFWRWFLCFTLMSVVLVSLVRPSHHYILHGSSRHWISSSITWWFELASISSSGEKHVWVGGAIAWMDAILFRTTVGWSAWELCQLREAFGMICVIMLQEQLDDFKKHVLYLDRYIIRQQIIALVQN